ncbi:conserved hypothetical protein (plasmid) [Borreliella spielmanii A14S]|uniref:Uncharacterized protein n=1 Tax=Borreliella spielmanii A14S TaxID=498742 RepID=C0RBL3_9SPIR|nr:conserved hypothetical protein [Borreliella spielmanii A14S]
MLSISLSFFYHVKIISYLKWHCTMFIIPNEIGNYAFDSKGYRELKIKKTSHK